MMSVRGPISNADSQGQKQPILHRGNGYRAKRKRRRGKAFQAQEIAGTEARKEVTYRMWGKDKMRQLDLARIGSYP